jgi:hypothetical protein
MLDCPGGAFASPAASVPPAPPHATRMPSRLRHRLVASFVALCLLLAGIAPDVSRVLAADDGLHDVCVAQGSAPGSGPAPAGHRHDADCPLCLTHAGSFAAPPPPGAVPAAPRAFAGPPASTTARDPAPTARWHAPPPRGPPRVA